MKTYSVNIERVSIENNSQEKVLYKGKDSSLVAISLRPKEGIREKRNKFSQFIRCEIGDGKVVINDVPFEMGYGFAMIIPAGAKHSIINTSPDKLMKLYTLYFS